MVNTGAAEAPVVIVTVSLVTAPATLVAVTVNVETPEPFGVPDNTPVVALSVKPLGKLPVASVNVGDGLPVAPNA